MAEEKLKSVVFTKHSLEKFMLITGCSNPERAEWRMRRMLEKSTRTELPAEVVAQRILRSKHIDERREIQDTVYYEFEQYRFAIVDNRVITFEKMYRFRKRGGSK